MQALLDAALVIVASSQARACPGVGRPRAAPRPGPAGASRRRRLLELQLHTYPIRIEDEQSEAIAPPVWTLDDIDPALPQARDDLVGRRRIDDETEMVNVTGFVKRALDAQGTGPWACTLACCHEELRPGLDRRPCRNAGARLRRAGPHGLALDFVDDEALSGSAVAIRNIAAWGQASSYPLLPPLPEPLDDVLAVLLGDRFADLADQDVLPVLAVVGRHVGDEHVNAALLELVEESANRRCRESRARGPGRVARGVGSRGRQGVTLGG